jgi:NitT/TauT family transport system permease protein
LNINNFIRKERICPKRIKREKILVLVIQISLLVLLFSLWEIFGRTGLINTFLFSYPSDIFKMFCLYLKNNEIFIHIGISVYETILGLVIGTIVGLIISIILWWDSFIEKILDPFLVVLNALPKTALAPIIIIWVGTGIDGIVCVAISISLVLTILSAYQYFKNVNYEQILMLKSFGANKFQILLKLIIPSNIGNLINLIKINIGMSWVGVIVGEFIVSKEGIGYLIMYGSQVFKMGLVMMGVLVLGILSFLMYEIVNLIEKLWKENRK